MAPVALKIREKTDVIQNEAQSLAVMKHLISTTFACVGYLRDLFDEGCFEDQKIADLSLKKFRRGRSLESDALLDWLEKGVYDALEKKFLRTVVFGVYLDSSKPADMIESYTFKISYAPFNDDNLNTQLTNLSIEQNDKIIVQFNQSEADFRKATVKILRTLCIMTQTLKALPGEKYLTMKLLYYDDRTPIDYQPPLFKESLEDLGFSPNPKPLKVDFGTAATAFHSINVKVQTASDTLNTEDIGSASLKSNIPSQGFGDNISLFAQSQKDICETREEKLMSPPSALESPAFSSIKPSKSPHLNGEAGIFDGFSFAASYPVMHLPHLESPTINEETIKMGHCKPIEIRPSHLRELEKGKEKRKDPEETSVIFCPCGCNEEDLAMIHCDCCDSWQHTVCAGYFSNTDKRMPKGDTKHLCFNCQYKGFPEKIKFSKILSAWRRALYIIFHEGLEGVFQFSRRLGIDLVTTKKLVARLIKEGFVLKTPKSENSVDHVKHGGIQNKWRYEVVKSADIKKRLKFYFSLDLTVFPEFVAACQGNKNLVQKASKKRALKYLKKIPAYDSKPITDSPAKTTASSGKRRKVSVPGSKIRCEYEQKN